MAKAAVLEPVTPSGRSRRWAGERFSDVLHRVALTANSSLEIREVLERLANLTLEAIPAERCSAFLLDESGTRLVPAFATGQVTDTALWQRFRGLNPVDLKEVPARWRAFRRGRALGIADMAASPLIPPEIVEMFGSRSAILMPLMAGGEPQGLIALDWTAPGREIPSEELALVEAIGAYAALAIRNARLYQSVSQKARIQERLVEVAGALSSSLSLRSVLDLICEAFEELLGTSHCSVNLIDESRPQRVRTLAVRGMAWFTGRPESPTSVSPKEIQRVDRLWKESPEPIVYPDAQSQSAIDRSLSPRSVQAAALFPLARPGELLGFVMAAFPSPGDPGRERLQTGQALADQATTAITRAILHENLQRRLQQTEVLYRLSDVVSGTSDLSTAMRELNRVLRHELGIQLKGVSIPNPRLRQVVGAGEPVNEEMEAIRSWRATLGNGTRSLSIRNVGDGVLVPIVHGRRIQGALRVSIDGRASASFEENVLLAVGAGFGEVLHKTSLRRDLDERERRLAIATERERIARDLHDSVVQLLTGMGMELAAWVDDAPNATWRERLQRMTQLASRGSREVRDAVHSLLFLQVRRWGLVSSLRDLCRKFETTTGIRTPLRVEGKLGSLTPAQEDGLFRIAHEALMNAGRHSRATVATLVIGFEPSEATISIRDDGVGLVHRNPFGISSSHFGLRGIQRLAQELGGDLKVQNAAPRGVLVSGRIPLKRRAK